MGIEWNVITSAHVQRACESVAARPRTRNRDKGLVIFSGDLRLPAKEILREAYRLAKGLSPDAEITFASGEATLTFLRRLGFRAERLRESAAPESPP